MSAPFPTRFVLFLRLTSGKYFYFQLLDRDSSKTLLCASLLKMKLCLFIFLFYQTECSKSNYDAVKNTYTCYNNLLMTKTFFRRLLLISTWPLIDFTVAVISNFFLLRFGFWTAVWLTIVLNTIVNILFLRLLYLEKEWVKKRTRKISFSKYEHISNTYGKTTAVLLAYLASGPAMVGVPLIWLFGIPRKRGYILAFIGVCLNTLVWVGGVYNLLWTLLRDIFHF